jgi:hypothetical protein
MEHGILRQWEVAGKIRSSDFVSWFLYAAIDLKRISINERPQLVKGILNYSG